MTVEDWKEVETRLSIPYSSVKLKIDGYDVTIGHAMEKPLKHCLVIYIDGIFKTKWVLEDCEIRRRFCSKHTKSLLTACQSLHFLHQNFLYFMNCYPLGFH